MNKFFIIMFSLAILTGCRSQQVSIFEIEWKLLRIKSKDYSSENPPVTLTLNRAEAKVSGFAGCNRFFGGYEYAGQQIKFKQFGATKMFCDEKMELEDNFLKALDEVDGYRMKGETLQLLTKDRGILEFSK